MRTAPSRFAPEDLRDPRLANEALAHWDELDPRTLAALEADPQHAPRLALLRSADQWLAGQLVRAQARGGRGGETPAGGALGGPNRGPQAPPSPESYGRPDPCPNADELYDFGRGPGYTPLAAHRRAEIDGHLARCRDCALLVESLASPPPVPLDDVSSTVPAAEPRERRGTETPLRPLRPVARPQPIRPASVEPVAVELGPRRRSRIPLAAAALVLVTGSLWIALREDVRPRFPSAPLLRGEAPGVLRYPRERVLATTPEVRAAWPALGERLAFELEPVAGASAYTIELLRHTGGAFAQGDPVLTHQSQAPSFEVDTRASLGSGSAGSHGEPAKDGATRPPATDEATWSPLRPGHYTWKATAVVHGLDQPLGARDFEVVADAEIGRRLVELARRDTSADTLAAVFLLDEQGYPGDARRIARQLPPSPARDEYLNRAPGR